MSSKEKPLVDRSEYVSSVTFNPDTERKLAKIAKRQHIPLTALIRFEVLAYIDNNPRKNLPEAPSEAAILDIKEVRPDAVVYVSPISANRIVATPHPEGGWRGILFNPQKTGAVAAWNGDNLIPPLWAKTPHTMMSLVTIASRIDSDGLSYFRIPRTNTMISASWNGKRFLRGEVFDLVNKRKRQSWVNPDGGWYAGLVGDYKRGECHYTKNRNVTRMINMITRAMRAGDGGLTADPPTW